MGFGLLLIGWFLAFVTSLSKYYLCYLLGLVVLTAAVTKLREYKRTYAYALIPLFPAMAYALYVTAYQFTGALPAPEGILATVLNSAFQLLLFSVHEILLYATAKIASGAGLERQKTASVRNMVWIGIAYAVSIVELTGLLDAWEWRGTFLLVLSLAAEFFCLWTIADCYRLIAPEDEDLNAPLPPTKIPVLNRLLAKMEAKQKKATEADVAAFRDYRERKRKRKK